MRGMGLHMGLSRSNRFNPAVLFGSSTAGAYYEISPSTTFTDSTGTTAAAVGQPVGLVLDSRFGLVRGSELIPEAEGNGTSVANWDTGTTTIVPASGEFLVTTTSGIHRVRHNVPVEPGKSYEYKWSSRLGTMTELKFSVYDFTNNGDIIPVTSYTAGSNRVVFKAPAGCTVAAIYLLRDSGVSGTAYFDNISVREIPGNHLTQATAASRPILRQDSGGYYYLEFDGVDDFLPANFTLAQPWDRLSAFRPISFTSTDVIFGPGTGASHSGCFLRQLTATPQLQAWSGIGTAAVFNGPTVGANGVVTERQDDANSRFALNNGAYTTADFDVTSPNGITVGAAAGGTQASHIRLYSLLMRSPALSDAETVLVRQSIAARAGVVL